MKLKLNTTLFGVLLFLQISSGLTQVLSQDTILYQQLYDEGMEYYIQGDQNKAKSYVIKLSELAYKNQWEDAWVSHVMEISSFELYEGDFNEALKLLDSLVRMADEGKIKQDLNKFRIYDRYSGFLANDGNVESSQLMLSKAAELIPNLPMKKQNTSKQQLENARALNYSKYGDLRRAKASFLRSIDLLHMAFVDGEYPVKDDYEFSKVILYKNVANNDIKAGEFLSAKLYLDSAIQTFEKLTDPYYKDSPMRAALNNTYGDYYKGMGDFELAERFMKDRIAELEKHENRVNLQMKIEATQNIADLYFKKGDVEAARLNYELSLKYLEDLKTSEVSKYRYLWKVIDFYQQIGEDHLSNPLLSLVDFEADPLRLYYSGAESSIVSMYALKANALATGYQNTDKRENLLFLEFNRKAISLSNQISQINNAGLSNELKVPTGLALDSYVQNLYMAYSNSPHAKDILVEALNVIDFAKNQNFNNQVKSVYLTKDAENSKLMETERISQRKLAELEKEYAKTSNSQVLDSIVKISRQLETVNAQLVQRSPELRSIIEFKINESILDGVKLMNDQQEVHYFYSDRFLHILSRDGSTKGWKWKSLNTGKLDSLIAQSGVSFQEISKMNWQMSSQQLYNILLGDILSPETKRLIIYPYGNIGLVPFAALVGKSGRYLVEDYAITVNSKFGHGEKAGIFSRNAKEILAFAPYFEGEEQQIQRSLYGYLGGTKEEVAGISRFFKTRLFEGLSATKDNFLKESRTSRFIHLATHAFAEQNVLFSKIVFSGGADESDHSLYGYEIADLDLDVDMLILSACQTGYGNFELGQGISSLAKLFADAGTKSLMYTLWNVDDYASAELMTLYYGFLEEGLTKDLALQAAQKAYLINKKDLKDMPYYWAGFVVSGDMSPVYGKSRIYLMVFLIGLVVLLLFLFDSRRKKQVVI